MNNHNNNIYTKKWKNSHNISMINNEILMRETIESYGMSCLFKGMDTMNDEW